MTVALVVHKQMFADHAKVRKNLGLLQCQYCKGVFEPLQLISIEFQFQWISVEIHWLRLN